MGSISPAWSVNRQQLEKAFHVELSKNSTFIRWTSKASVMILTVRNVDMLLRLSEHAKIMRLIVNGVRSATSKLIGYTGTE